MIYELLCFRNEMVVVALWSGEYKIRDRAISSFCGHYFATARFLVNLFYFVVVSVFFFSVGFLREFLSSKPFVRLDVQLPIHCK